MAAETLDTGGLSYNSAKTAMTVTADYDSASLKSNDYESGVVTITASSRTAPLNIEGNAKANKIIGTGGDDTLLGATGNDTLTGGEGADIFLYDGKGTDVVTDYTAGDDTIKISSGSVSSYSFSGSDAIFKVGSGTLKVKGGKSSAITVVDSKNKVQTYDGGLIYDGTVAKAKALTVTAAYGNTLASYGASVVTIDSSARTKALNITGNAANNFIVGTSGNDTIYGGEGNDTLTGGKGKDLFIYESGGGNDVIADYTAGQDTLKISGEISSYSISGSDATFKIGSGSVKITGGKTAAITVVDENKNVSTYHNGAIYNAASATKATAITLTAGYSDSSLTAGTNVVTVDASPRTAAIKIVGNTKNNFLAGGSGKDSLDGGKGNDTLSGGKGADTLTGGAGKDVFIYANGDGSDVITDYTSGEDIIKLTSGEVKDYSIKNGDAILKVGSDAITLKGAGTNAISVRDADDALRTYSNGLIYNATKISRSNAVTITAGYDDTEFGSYGASVETIDASSRSKALEIVGNTGANYILGSKGKDTIDGGKGADTLIGGKGNDLLTGGRGADVFFYTTGDGNDVITDYTGGEDIISLAGNYSVSYSVKNDDAVIKIGSGNITLKNAAETAITIVGADNIASIYSGSDVSTETWAGAADVAETVTVNVTLPAETVTVGGETVTETVTVEVTLPAETVTVGGGETVTVTVGGGVETIVGTSGDDIFVYSGGYDIITDYGTGNDTISLSANSVSGGAVIGSDVLLEIGDGILKLNGAKDKIVTIVSGETVMEYFNGEIYGETYTLPADQSVNFTLASYNNSVDANYVHIDGSNVTKRIGIYGDERGNIIQAGSVGSYLYGGRGDDTLYFGGGADYVYYYQYGGSDIVYNFQSGDQIIFDDSKTGFGNLSLSGGDLIVNTVDEDSITLKDVKEQTVYLWDAKTWRSYSGTFADATVSGAAITLDSTYQGYFNATWYADTFQTIDASAVVNTLYLYGNDEDNFIRASKAGDYIYAGAGNDTISLGGGTSYVYYEQYGGSDVILNYKSGARIYFSDSKTGVENISLSGSGDLIINTVDEETVTLKNVKLQTIYIYNNKDDTHYSGTLANATISGSGATLASTYEGTFYAPFYADSIQTINGSSVSNFISILGGDSDDFIRAGKAGGRIYAGEGNDTVYFGNGADYFYYYQNGGSDTIHSYKTGDQIIFDDSKTGFDGFAIDDGDLIINTVEEEKLTLKDVATQTIYIWDNRSWKSYSGTFANATVSGGSATLGTTYTGTFNADWYTETPTTIDATTTKNSITLSGGDAAEEFRAGEGGDYIYAGKGDDTIYAGAGVDRINFYKDDGNETVYDLGEGDYVYLNNCSAESVSVSGTDVIITTNYAETITLKEATGKNIWITGQNWQTYAAEETALLTDDNFSADDLGSLVEDVVVTNLNFSATDTENIFAPEITYGTDK